MGKLICLDFGGSSIKYGALDRSSLRTLTDKGRVPNSFADREEFLDAVLRYAGLDRKGRKDAMQELDMLWPEGHLLPEPEDLRGRTENLAGAVGLFQALIGAAGQKTR